MIETGITEAPANDRSRQTFLATESSRRSLSPDENRALDIKGWVVQKDRGFMVRLSVQ